MAPATSTTAEQEHHGEDDRHPPAGAEHREGSEAGVHQLRHLSARVAALRLRAPVALVLVGDRPYGVAEVAATPVAHARAADSDAASSAHTIQQTRTRAVVRKVSGM
ncbi:MAG: hypothetical protein KY458_07605 [Actinobacteria bacterium]|nr:hypothetical protein [Actinomycetota bacterium]